MAEFNNNIKSDENNSNANDNMKDSINNTENTTKNNNFSNSSRFKSNKDAEDILAKSRTRIEEIDSEIIDLINERTFLAKDILDSKMFLDIDIYDESREKFIHNKVLKLASDKNINNNSHMIDGVIKIINILIFLSKEEQKEILRRKENGKY
ncbi:MAG: chorismate mutase [Methanobacteriaceae archaeon]